MRYYVEDKNMNEWKKIAKAYAKKVDCELIFVNNESFGIETKKGQFKHIYIDELEELLGGAK